MNLTLRTYKPGSSIKFWTNRLSLILSWLIFKLFRQYTEYHNIKEKQFKYNSVLKTNFRFCNTTAFWPIWLTMSILLLFYCASLNAQHTITRYTMDDGLPNSVVLDIAKDRDGFIWVHTFGGICRFDGYDFKNYKVTLGGEERAVPSFGKFMTDTKKDLWISSYYLDSTIFRYNNENDKLELCAKEYNELDLFDRDYLFTSDNRLLCWSDSVLYFSELVNNRFQTTGRYALDYSLAGSRMMVQLPDSSLWMLMRSGLYLMDTINEKLRLNEYSLVSEGSIDDKEKLCQILHTDSLIFILRDHSLFYADILKIDHRSKRIIGKKLSFMSTSAGKKILQLVSMNYDGTDRLFLRTEQGVFSYSLSTQIMEWLFAEEITANDVGQGMFAQAIFYDNDILWIGSDQGLVKINVPVNPFHLVHPLHQLDRKSVV